MFRRTAVVSVLIFVILIGITLAGHTEEGRGNVEGTATTIVGTVTLKRGDETRTLSEEDKIYAGDVIEAAESSSLLVTLPDETTMLISENTITRVERSRLNTFSVTLFEGSILHNVTPRGERGSYTVITPSASVGVRGTRFLTSVAKDGSTRITADEGEVGVKGKSGEEVSVSRGRRTEVELNQNPGAVQRVSGRDSAEIASDAAWAMEKDAALESRAGAVMHSVNDVILREDARQRDLNDRFIAFGVRLSLFIRNNADRDGLSNADEGLDLLIEGLRLFRDIRESQHRTDASYYVGRNLNERYAPDSELYAQVSTKYDENLQMRSSKAGELDSVISGLERLSSLLSVARSPVVDVVRGLPSFGLF